jgi:hypothetical protein
LTFLTPCVEAQAGSNPAKAFAVSSQRPVSILSKDPLTLSGFSPNQPGFFGQTVEGVRQAVFNCCSGALWTQRKHTKTILSGGRFDSCPVHCLVGCTGAN